MGNYFAPSPKLLFTAEKKLITDLVHKNCVVVFSKTQCIYCKRVKKLLSDTNVNYMVVELDKREDGKNLQEALSEITGAKTVPRVFINGECIGGASESEKLHKENKLLEKIYACKRNETIHQ